jgi:hypothetical protein
VQRHGNAKPPEKIRWTHMGAYMVVWAIWALDQGLINVSREQLKQLNYEVANAVNSHQK